MRSGGPQKYGVLFLLLALLAVTRLVPLLYPSVQLLRPFDAEKLFIGAIAKDLIAGSRLPLFCYQWPSHTGAPLVSGFLAVPLFKVFGESLFSLSLLGVLYSMAMLVTLYLFLSEYFNRRIAIIASSLFIFSPTIFFRYSLMSQGNCAQYHIALFHIITVYIFYRIFFDRKTSYMNYSLLGFISGFAVYFSYTFLATPLAFFLFWFAEDKRFILGNKFAVFAASFMAGLIPWAYHSFHTDFESFFKGPVSLLSYLSMRNPFLHMSRLSGIGGYNIFVARPPYPYPHLLSIGRFLSPLYIAMVFISFMVVAWADRRAIGQWILRVISPKNKPLSAKDVPRELFFLVHPALFLLLYSFWGIPMHWRYTGILLFSAFVVIALFLARIYNSGNKASRWALAFFIIILAASSALSMITHIHLGNYRKCFKERGYSYAGLGISMADSLSGKILHSGQIEQFLPMINEIGHRHQGIFYRNLGYRIGFRLYADSQRIQAVGGAIPQQWRVHFYEGIGRGMAEAVLFLRSGRGAENRFNSRLDVCIAALNGLPGDYTASGYLGFGRSILEISPEGLGEMGLIGDRVAPDYKAYFYIGLGEALGDRFKYRLGDAKGAVDYVDMRYRRYCYEGIGRFLAQSFPDDLAKAEEFVGMLSREYRPYCYKGIR